MPLALGEFGVGQNFSFPSVIGSNFEFKNEDIGNGDSSDPSHRGEDISGARSMTLMTETSQCSTCIVPVLDGLPTIRQSRRYSMCNRQSRETPVQGMGVRIQDRVKLNNVCEPRNRVCVLKIVFLNTF